MNIQTSKLWDPLHQIIAAGAQVIIVLESLRFFSGSASFSELIQNFSDNVFYAVLLVVVATLNYSDASGKSDKNGEKVVLGDRRLATSGISIALAVLSVLAFR